MGATPHRWAKAASERRRLLDRPIRCTARGENAFVRARLLDAFPERQSHIGDGRCPDLVQSAFV